MSIYDPYEIGGDLRDLHTTDVAFVLLKATTRLVRGTEYGDRRAVDLRIALPDGLVGLWSGWAAGIVFQVERIEDGDLPACFRLVTRATRKGATLVLAPVDRETGEILPDSKVDRAKLADLHPAQWKLIAQHLAEHTGALPELPEQDTDHALAGAAADTSEIPF